VGVGVAVGVGVGVGDADGVADAVADGEVIVPPGVRGGVELVLCVGAGCTGVALGAAGDCGLGCGRAGGLALGLGDGVACTEARRTAARSTGMFAGCWARPPVWLAVRVPGNVPGSIPAALVVAAWLAEAENEQGCVVAWRVACAPVNIMLTAPEITESPANRPTAGVIASRLVIVALSLPSSGTFAVALLACQRAKHSQPL